MGVTVYGNSTILYCSVRYCTCITDPRTTCVITACKVPTKYPRPYLLPRGMAALSGERHMANVRCCDSRSTLPYSRSGHVVLSFVGFMENPVEHVFIGAESRQPTCRQTTRTLGSCLNRPAVCVSGLWTTNVTRASRASHYSVIINANQYSNRALI